LLLTACINNGGDDAIAGAGIFFGKNDKRNCTIHIPPELSQTNQVAEAVAAKEAVENASDADTIVVMTDSMHVIDNITK
jgi:ribonuclease HI